MLLQEELILKIKEKGSNSPNVNAILMYGSFTQGCGDAYSDIEFYVFIEDKDYDNFDSNKWVSNVYPVATYLVNEYGTDVFIFDNLIRGEFHFLPTKDMSIVEAFAPVGFFPDIDAMCLYDKSNKLIKYLSTLKDSKINRHSVQNIEFVINNFLNAILYGINVLKRGEISRSLECIGTVQRFYLQLVRLDENKINHWVNPTKGLESEISSDYYKHYKKCTSNLDEKNLLSAYQELLSGSEAIVRILASRYNFNCNYELFKKLNDYIN